MTLNVQPATVAQARSAEIIDFARARAARDQELTAAAALDDFRVGKASFPDLMKALIAPFSCD
jgi:hypothetical protein